jgi:hypothetical protein
MHCVVHYVVRRLPVEAEARLQPNKRVDATHAARPTALVRCVAAGRAGRLAARARRVRDRREGGGADGAADARGGHALRADEVAARRHEEQLQHKAAAAARALAALDHRGRVVEDAPHCGVVGTVAVAQQLLGLCQHAGCERGSLLAATVARQQDVAHRRPGRAGAREVVMHAYAMDCATSYAVDGRVNALCTVLCTVHCTGRWPMH